MSPRTVSPGAEDDAGGHLRAAPGELLVEVPPAEPGHAEIGDDQVELLAIGEREPLPAVSRDDGDVAPRLECGAHVVQDVRLVIDDEHP